MNEKVELFMEILMILQTALLVGIWGMLAFKKEDKKE